MSFHNCFLNCLQQTNDHADWLNFNFSDQDLVFALAYFKTMTLTHPLYPQAIFMKGILYQRNLLNENESYDKAMKLFELSGSLNNLPALMHLAKVHLNKDSGSYDIKRAILLLDQAISLQSKEACIIRAQLHEANNNFNAANDLYNLAALNDTTSNLSFEIKRIQRAQSVVVTKAEEGFTYKKRSLSESCMSSTTINSISFFTKNVDVDQKNAPPSEKLEHLTDLGIDSPTPEANISGSPGSP